MRGVPKGVTSNGEPAICMVVGCGRKAIYRNANTNNSRKSMGSKGTQHGYCSQHRELAVSAPLSQKREEWLLRDIDSGLAGENYDIPDELQDPTIKED
mgnify:CR=1 FL=1